jgi:hypothetical protein
MDKQSLAKRWEEIRYIPILRMRLYEVQERSHCEWRNPRLESALWNNR